MKKQAITAVIKLPLFSGYEVLKMILREFRESDAEKIISWLKNEREVRLWCADRYDHFPILPEDMIMKYSECGKTGIFFPITAVSEQDEPIGHLILRYTDDVHETVRFGFVIVEPSQRGTGKGREMLRLAIDHAAKVMNAKKLSLGVFDNNRAAFNCYKAAGFNEINSSEGVFEIFGEKWKCIEMGMNVI